MLLRTSRHAMPGLRTRSRLPLVCCLRAAHKCLESRLTQLEHFESLCVDQICTGQAVLGNEYRFAAPVQLFKQFRGSPHEGCYVLGAHEDDLGAPPPDMQICGKRGCLGQLSIASI